MKPDVFFIHGMFLTGKSWEHWIQKFSAAGYVSHAPNWPLHDGDPAQLRVQIPAGLGELKLETLVEHFAAMAQPLEMKPILIGHSLGGLVAQRLVARGLASAAICISTVPPNGMMAADWGFLRNSTEIANPFKGNEPFPMTVQGFHKNFANTMSRGASDLAWQRYAVPESRNVLRDAMGKAGHVDTQSPHVPLLFIAGEKDEIIPNTLDRRVSKHYTDPNSKTDFQEFKGRGHFICGEPGWEEVATFCLAWLAPQWP
jgi:pimeloyl-ACP methyl ester carboxylesterase